MKKILALVTILGTVAFGAEATTSKPAAQATATPQAVCPVTGGEAKGTGMGMNHGKGDGTGAMMKGNKEGRKGQGRMMESLSQKDQETLTKNREAMRAQRVSGKADWNQIQKLSDENALIISRGRVEMMKKGNTPRNAN